MLRCRWSVDRLTSLYRQSPVKLWREIILASIDGALGLHRWPGQAHQADADYPTTTGRNFDEILRVLDSMQLTAKHKVSTPVNQQQGEDVIIAGSVSDEDAKTMLPVGWKAPKPYLRITSQPG